MSVELCQETMVNKKLVIFSSLVTAVVGAMLGLAAGEIAAPKYESQFYQDLKDQYVLIGAGLGLAIGASQETLRQIQKQQDQQERESSDRWYRAKDNN